MKVYLSDFLAETIAIALVSFIIYITLMWAMCPYCRSRSKISWHVPPLLSTLIGVALLLVFQPQRAVAEVNGLLLAGGLLWAAYVLWKFIYPGRDIKWTQYGWEEVGEDVLDPREIERRARIEKRMSKVVGWILISLVLSPIVMAAVSGDWIEAAAYLFGYLVWILLIFFVWLILKLNEWYQRRHGAPNYHSDWSDW